MNRSPVSSINVASVGYDGSTLTLEVEFLSGSVYQYFDVPNAVYRLEFRHSRTRRGAVEAAKRGAPRTDARSDEKPLHRIGGRA